jgi:hypothetical protein
MPYKIEELAGSPYRPHNGTEGLIFEHRFCSRCIKDRVARLVDEDGKLPEGRDWSEACQIWTGALVFDLDDPNYPAELVHDAEGRPTCTAFEQDPDEEVWQGERPPFPLPAEIVGAYIPERLKEPS